MQLITIKQLKKIQSRHSIVIHHTKVCLITIHEHNVSSPRQSVSCSSLEFMALVAGLFSDSLSTRQARTSLQVLTVSHN